MAALVAIGFLLLIALDLWRDRPVDPRPVVEQPRWIWLVLLGCAAASAALPPVLFLAACCALGALAALALQRFRLTAEGLEAGGALFAWPTLEVRRTRLFVVLRTARGQRLRLPAWMDGLATLLQVAGRLGAWRSSGRPGASWS